MSKTFEAESNEDICSENHSDGQDDSAFDKHEAESENWTSDESDAPVGVSWEDSKAEYQQVEKNRNDAVNFARSIDKEKRRKKNEMFVSQKQAKRKHELTKLPDEILQAVVKKPRQVEMDSINKGNKMKSKKLKKSKKSKKERKETEEYCHVVILEEELNKSKKVQESAAKFLKDHLYGNRLQRTSGSTQWTMQCKSSGVLKPAVKFKRKV